MRITSAGNVGIGTIPSAWSGSGADVLQNDRLSLAGIAGNSYFSNNWYTDGSSSRYIATGAASQIRMADDTIIFNRAGSGSANATFSFSESMRIDSNGTLIIGATSTQSSEKLSVYGSETGGGAGIAYFKNTASGTSGDGAPPVIITKTSATTSSSARFVQFYANNLTQPMGGIVGNGAENVQFLTLSDEREKTNIQPVSGSLNRIMQLQVSSFDRIGSSEHVNAGFIAQNVLPIYPEYVVENASNEGKEQRYGITGGMSAGYIAELTKAIQEQQAIINDLKARIETLESK
jgi:hypothetical protein